MFGTHFNHEICRKLTAGFGTMFNDIEFVETNNSNQELSRKRVPLNYIEKPKLKALVEQGSRADKQNDDDGPSPVASTQMTMPRMAFRLSNMTYDPQRKTNTFLTRSKTLDESNVVRTYNKIPYDFEFELDVFGEKPSHVYQILEQILPFFTPTLTLTINMIDNLWTKEDIKISIASTSKTFPEERTFTPDLEIYEANLVFNAKGYLYGPETNSGLIRSVRVNLEDPTNSSIDYGGLTMSVSPSDALPSSDFGCTISYG